MQSLQYVYILFTSLKTELLKGIFTSLVFMCCNIKTPRVNSTLHVFLEETMYCSTSRELAWQLKTWNFGMLRPIYQGQMLIR